MIIKQTFTDNFFNKIGGTIKNSLKKNLLIEGCVTEGLIKPIRYLKPRIDFTSTKKNFGYRLLKEFKVQLITAKVKKFYSGVGFELKPNFVYYLGRNLKKRISKKRWYKTYNYFKAIQHWFLKNKLRYITKRQTSQFLVRNISKFQTIQLGINNKMGCVNDQLKMTYKALFKAGKFRAVRYTTLSFKDYLLTRKGLKSIRTFRRKRALFFILLKKLNHCCMNLTMMCTQSLVKLSYNKIFFFKYYIKFLYMKLLMLVNYRVFKKVRLNCVTSNLKYFFYKSLINILKKIKRLNYLKTVGKVLNETEVKDVLNNSFIIYSNANILLLITEFLKELFKIFLNYLIFCSLHKIVLVGILRVNTIRTLVGQIDFYRGFDRTKLDYLLAKKGYAQRVKQLKVKIRFHVYKFKSIRIKTLKLLKY